MPNDNAASATPGSAAVRAHDVPKRPAAVQSVSYTGHTKLIFLWPVILLGYLFLPLSGWANTGTLGWIYVLTLVFCILAVSVDLNRNYGIFWLLLVALIVIVGKYLEKVHNIPLLGDLYRWFAHRNVAYDAPTGLAISILLSLVFLIGIIWSYGNNRYTMTHNELIHHVWGRGDTSIGRGARVITITYPDFFEAILCLAGTVIVFDNTGRTTISRTDHVPFLLLKSRQIEKLMESVEVTADGASDTAAAAGAASANADDWH